jgi:HlyD family secretion protein
MKIALPFRSDRRRSAHAGRAPRPRRASGFLRLAVVLVCLGALVGGFFYWRSQQNVAAAASTVSVPVMKGNLDVNVESNGKVEATRSSALKFETGGQVTEVLVKPGDKVAAGQPLVKLADDELRLKVQQAEANLKSAQATLNDLKRGSSAAKIAGAEAALQAAQADLDAVRAGPTAREIADAQAELRLAQAKLQSVKAGPTAREMADAQADLDKAQADLERVKAGATAKEISDAEAELKAAQARLDSARTPPSAAELAAAESDLSAAQLKLSALKGGPDEATLSEDQLKVTQAETALNKTRSSSNLAKQEAEIAFQKADRAMHEAQREYYVLAGEALDENGQVRGDLMQGQVDAYYEALDAMRDAEADYHKAQFTLDDVRQKEVQDVAAAEAVLADAKKQLQDVKAGATPSELADAQLAVDKARKTLDDLKAGPDGGDVADAEAALSKARAKLAELRAGPSGDKLAEAEAAAVKARNKVDELKSGPSGEDLAEAQTSVDKAQNKLNELKSGSSGDKIAEAQAAVAREQANLQDLKEPPTETELASAEEDVVTARAGLEDATANLKKATVTAPFDATVAEVDAVANSTVAAGDEAVTIYDRSGMHLDLEVSESDIERVKVGQPVDISFDALPDKTITGTVTMVSTVATSGQDVVTYLVQVEFDPGSLPVKVGMSANANIRVERREGVIQVPNRALGPQGVSPQGPFKTLQVLYGKDQAPVTVRVQTGATNGQMTEIVKCMDTNSQCLREGDKVAMSVSINSQSRGGPGGDMVIFGPAGPGGAAPGGSGFSVEVKGP